MRMPDADFAIDFSFKPIPEGFVLAQCGSLHIRRRHDARSKLANDLLPQLGMIAYAGKIQTFERQVRGFRPAVVAGHTKLIEKRACAGCGDALQRTRCRSC